MSRSPQSTGMPPAAARAAIAGELPEPVFSIRVRTLPKRSKEDRELVALPRIRQLRSRRSRRRGRSARPQPRPGARPHRRDHLRSARGDRASPDHPAVRRPCAADRRAGLAKTRLVETLGTILGLDDKRIQCTPDLMPADILGSEVLEESETGRRSFRFIPGPVFCQLLMADEINRASPRTQSALLQAMQEGRVSIAGQYHPLPRPFHVLATQNPLEQEGTYPLPEAQLDRFPAADRRRLSRPRRRAADADRHHRRRRGPAAAGDERRRADRGAAPGAPHPGRRERRRGDPGAGALGPAGRRPPTRSRALSRGDRGRAPARR